MKRLLILLILFFRVVSGINSQYVVDRVYYDIGNTDTLYSKIGNGDSLFRKIAGEYVFALKSKSKKFTSVESIIGTLPIGANLISIGALANSNGFLKNNGSGIFTYENPAGSGTVTDMSIVSANGISGSVATSTSTPAVTLSLGAITPTTVNGHTFTTGSSTFTGTAGQTYTMPAVTSTLLANTTTSGVAASPTASTTVTVTHGLGRVPTTIRIKSISSFTSNAAATPVPFSEGTWNSTGNRCLYMVINGTTTQVSQTSTVFSIIMVTSAGNSISGVIGNVTSTGFDIVFTETGTHTAGNYLWEAQ